MLVLTGIALPESAFRLSLKQELDFLIMAQGTSKADVAIEQFGKAIGNRTRAHILQLLSRGSRSVQGLVEAVGPLSQPAVSQHLKLLRNATLVSATRCGSEVHYSFERKKYHSMLHTCWPLRFGPKGH